VAVVNLGAIFKHIKYKHGGDAEIKTLCTDIQGCDVAAIKALFSEYSAWFDHRIKYIKAEVNGDGLRSYEGEYDNTLGTLTKVLEGYKLTYHGHNENPEKYGAHEFDVCFELVE
jgi:hypothetical protein